MQRVGGGVSAESRRCVQARSWRCESVGLRVGGVSKREESRGGGKDLGAILFSLSLEKVNAK